MKEKLLRTTEEIGPDGAVNEILDDPENHSAYVGFEPSGHLHIGHLVVAQKMIDLQEIGIDITILLADIHASLNGKGTIEEIQKTGEEMIEEFITFGLDPEQTNFIFGSEFQSDLEYQMKVQELAKNTTLDRAKRSMAEIGSDQEKVSNVLYPVMQVIDIHHLNVDIAVGGMEQRKVHMLARDILPRIDITPPKYIHTPLIEDLDGGESKMSTSEGISVSTSDSPKEIRTAVNNAFCPPATTTEDGKSNPIIQIAEFLIFPRKGNLPVTRSEEFGGNVTFYSIKDLHNAVDSGDLHPDDLKSAVAEQLINILC